MPAKPFMKDIFSDTGVHKGTTYAESKLLQGGTKNEPYATGKNSLTRDVNKTKSTPKLGVKGFVD